MPYIKQSDRTEYISVLFELPIPRNPGELNFVITKIIDDYANLGGLNYNNINDVIGALEACKLEFYRRVVAGYEDKKITDNGDVY